jgi:glutathione S-transferase
MTGARIFSRRLSTAHCMHPAGTAPVITDGDLVMGESTAIVEYISQRHGGGALSVPASDPDYPQYLYWM